MNYSISRRWLLPFLVLVVLSPLSATAEGKNNWPGWRGENMDATVKNAGVFENGQHYQLKVKWKKELGSGYSAISVLDGVAVTMFSDSTDDFVVALNANDGSELWRYKIDTTHTGRNGSQNGPLSTPLIAEKKVFGLGPNGQLFALELHTGREHWRVNISKVYGAIKPFYGFATSPLSYGNAIIVQIGGQMQNTVAAFNKDTGEPLWAEVEDRVLYQSPVITFFNNRLNLLCIGNKLLSGLVPESGEILWQYAHNGHANWAYGGASMNPVILPDNRIFLMYKHQESVLLEVKTNGDKTFAEEVWRTKEIKKNYTDPVYWNGYLYGFSGAFLTCISTSDGKRIWKSRQPGDGSLIVVDGHLVITTKTGGLHIAAASPEGYSERARLKLFDELCWTAPSFAEGKIYARSHGQIASIEIIPTDQTTILKKKQSSTVKTRDFNEFIKSVSNAIDKRGLIEEFMAKNKQTPLIDDDGMVHFWYRGEAEEIALIGDISGFDRELLMHRIEGTDFFHYSILLELDAQIGYMFLKNETQRIVDPLNTNRATTRFFGRGYELSLVTMPLWDAPKHLVSVWPKSIKL